MLISKDELQQIVLARYNDVIAKINFKIMCEPTKTRWSFDYNHLGMTKDDLQHDVFRKLLTDKGYYFRLLEDKLVVSVQNYFLED